MGGCGNERRRTGVGELVVGGGVGRGGQYVACVIMLGGVGKGLVVGARRAGTCEGGRWEREIRVSQRVQVSGGWESCVRGRGPVLGLGGCQWHWVYERDPGCIGYGGERKGDSRSLLGVDHTGGGRRLVQGQ